MRLEPRTWGMDVGPRPMGLLASLALARFAVTKPLTSHDYLCNALRKSSSRVGSNKARWKSSNRHQKMPPTSGGSGVASTISCSSSASLRLKGGMGG